MPLVGLPKGSGLLGVKAKAGAAGQDQTRGLQQGKTFRHRGFQHQARQGIVAVRTSYPNRLNGIPWSVLLVAGPRASISCTQTQVLAITRRG